ncbi:MAG: DNA ligase D [Syntrophales bacterium]|nr:DNA ligase D [Syntrophales bacterium]
MPLREYHRKRKFKKTPEPQGGPAAKGGAMPLRFVVQKHAASRLHYDLRLELDGVLKSWAVPKGIRPVPEEKHLAVMVEDHPLEYRSFEGVIPKGNYGAGTVMIWDEGCYASRAGPDRAVSERAVMEGLKKGHISFVLEGKKLHGEFALVKLKRGKENEWLLIKKKDEYAAGPEYAEDDRSAATGRTMDEIAGSGEQAAARPDLPALGVAALPRSPMPDRISPMLATLVEEPFDRSGWLFEIKWDGYRAFARVSGGKAVLYSRNGNVFNAKFPETAKALEGMPFDAALDGELVALDSRGKADFQLLQNYLRTGRGSLFYYVFDILHLEGRSLLQLPLRRRRHILKQILPGIPGIRVSEDVEGDGVSLFREVVKNGVEGILAKDVASPYRPGIRGRDWLKIKATLRQEAVIGGYTAPRKGRKHLGALVLGVYESGNLVYIGHSGGGFTDRDLLEIRKRLDAHKTDRCPFRTAPRTNTPVTWVEPVLVCEVRFSEWTEEGLMRHPIYLGMREDKDPREVTREIPGSASRVLKEPRFRISGAGDRTVKIDGIDIRLTNLDKVFWPEHGYTKGDLIDYYRRAARLILPHLQDRPQSLHRFPDGIYGESFFQKDMTDKAPSWITTVGIRTETEDKQTRYILCQNEAALVYMANLGCIEINPWNSRFQNPDYPDYLVLDIDPLDIAFDRVVEAALETKAVLDIAGAPGFCKTSGATGLHIFVPTGGKYTTEQVLEFAKIVNSFVNARLPATTSLERPPLKREKRVYLDFLQNRRCQTMASVYSVRPRAGAPVSAPLRWKEVRTGLDPAAFNLRTMPGRIDRVGDLWEGVLGPGIDMQRCLERLDRAARKFFGGEPAGRTG